MLQPLSPPPKKGIGKLSFKKIPLFMAYVSLKEKSNVKAVVMNLNLGETGISD